MTKLKIDVNADVTSRLGFEPMAQFGNLCPAYLTTVEVTTSKIDDDSKWEYAGHEVPRLAFHFTEWKENASDKDRFFTHAELPIAIVKTDGTNVTEENLEKMYTEMWKRIKHIHDQFEGSPNYKAISFNVEFEPSAPLEERIKAFTKFFDNIAKSFNVGKDGSTPIFGAKDLVALKLIASGKKLSYYGLPTFVGKGFIERVSIAKGKMTTTLRFGASENVKLGVQAGIMANDNATTGGEVPEELAAKLGL